MNRIKFLGIGAGDTTMTTQIIPTSSIYCELDNLKFIIDPGPGTLVNAKINNVNLLDLNGILLSHLHPDHSTDVNAILSELNKNPTFLIAEEHCLKPSKEYYPCVSKFHQTIPQIVKAVKPGDKVEIGDLIIETVKAEHYCPTVGFVIRGSKNIGYTSDGPYHVGQENFFKNSDILILNTYFLQKIKLYDLHMDINDAKKLIGLCKPKLAIIQHFSLELLEADPTKQAKLIEKQTGIKTIDAKAGLEINLDLLK